MPKRSRAEAAFTDTFNRIVENIEQVIQGKHDVIRLSLVCLVAEGHLLIEDVPGVGKTSLAKALAASIDCQCQRIQFTPDLLPSDITGVSVFNRSNDFFEFRPGGIFANIVLGDEVNRASPKTQSALLEAMEEHQVTVDAVSYALPRPFMVVATQNPLDQEGTYPLPESQLDRFLMRISVGYPDRSAELTMLETHGMSDVLAGLVPVATAADVNKMIDAARAVYVAPAIRDYIVDIAEATRAHPSLSLGVSPRAALALLRAARAQSAASGRDYVIPDDIQSLAAPVLEHRLSMSPEAQLGGIGTSDVIADVLERVPVPTNRRPSTRSH